MKVRYPVDEMRRFHQKARKQVAGLERAIGRLERTGDAAAFEGDFVGFFNFCENELPLHMDDEEQALFPLLRTLPEEGTEYQSRTISDMLGDHKDVFAAVEVIRLMKRLLGGEAETDGKFLREIRERARLIVDTLDDHFLKEEQILFRAAEERFTQEMMSSLASRMNRIRECRMRNGYDVKSCKVR